jgi:hypothetical protein
VTMETPDPSNGHSRWRRARELAGPIVSWSVWAGMTVALVLFVRQYTRNVPYKDDVALVGLMTGIQPVDLNWLWSQHNEHRPVLSRLILAGVTRVVEYDFRTGLYLNAAMMSAAAAGMLLLARKVRGSTRITDSVLPLSILASSQTETLTIGFALNLILTAWISYELIAMTILAGQRSPDALAVKFGLILVLLPLVGGSGLVMLPPLALWLIGYLSWGWWSGSEPGRVAKAIGVGLLMATSALAALYLSGYARPPYHPSAPSLAAVASTTLECLSVLISPGFGTYWKAAGLLVAFLSVVTLARLTIVGVRAPTERPRAIGLIAIILALLGTAVAVGVSRSGLGPGAGLADRYVTIMAPLLCAIYIAWLVYAPARRRQWFSVGLLVVIVLMVPINGHRALDRGRAVRRIEQQVVRSLKAKVPASLIVSRACPDLFPTPDDLYNFFRMLRTARIGLFKDLVDDRIATAPEGSAGVRR